MDIFTNVRRKKNKLFNKIIDSLQNKSDEIAEYEIIALKSVV